MPVLGRPPLAKTSEAGHRRIPRGVPVRPWNVAITHCCVGWGRSWAADVRRAFAALEWTVTDLGAVGSSTHVEDDFLYLTSTTAPFDPAVLADVLAQLGVSGGEYEYTDGVDSSRHEWDAVIDERWWNGCTDP